MRNSPRGAAIYGIDIGKYRFDVVALDAAGAVVHRAKFRRDTMLAHFAAAPKALSIALFGQQGPFPRPGLD